MKVEHQLHGDRKVYTVSAFNRGVASWLTRLPTIWVEGEVTEFRRQDRWQSVFFTLKDPRDGSCLPVSMPRSGFDALRLELVDGTTVHVFGRPELFAARGEFRLRALTIEPLGLGALLAGIEQLKRRLAGEGLFASARKRPLPLFPRRIALVTGNEAAAKRDFVTAVTARFPAAQIVIAQTYVQGPRAAPALTTALADIVREPGVDVVVLTRGGGSFEDLLPFSDERLVRAVTGCPVPVVSAVGHEQDTPLCDLAADARASTPTAAARLVDPDPLRHRPPSRSAGGDCIPGPPRAAARPRRPSDPVGSCLGPSRVCGAPAASEARADTARHGRPSGAQPAASGQHAGPGFARPERCRPDTRERRAGGRAPRSTPPPLDHAQDRDGGRGLYPPPEEHGPALWQV